MSIDPDALADAFFAGRPRRGRKLRQPESADALVTSLQLADLAAGREPVEGAVIREVEARRAVMRMVTERVVGVGAEKEVERG